MVPLAMLADGIVPLNPAAFAPPAKIAYGDGVKAWRGVSAVNAPAPLVRPAISRQRAGPVKAPAPKSSVVVRNPLATLIPAFVTGPAMTTPGLLVES